MATIQELVEKIVEGIQEKKGRDITIIDLGGIITAPAQRFVICSGGSPQQVQAVAESVSDFARKDLGERPSKIAGRENAEWIAMDYGTVLVHVFLPEAREHYDLENLWDDAPRRDIPNLD